MDVQKYIDLLIDLEPAVREAADIAVTMQAGINPSHKATSGNLAKDIVTEADFLVQQALLRIFVQTPLIHCKLYAEEDTPLVDQFSENASLFLAIDPIDGTKKFADGGTAFSTMISLFDRRKPLYNFVYFPRLEWSLSLRADQLVEVGQRPKTAVDENLSKTIVYSDGLPLEALPRLSKELIDGGYIFSKSDTLKTGGGGKFLTFSRQCGGYFTGGPCVYDGLPALHLGRALGYQVDTSGFDLTDIVEVPGHGFHFRGHYLLIAR